MSIGFPISDGNGHGTDPATMRRILGAHWANVGVIDGCGVGTSSSGLTYTVAAGRAVSTRGTSYGKVEFEVPASTATTTAGPSSGSRIDVVWAKPNDPSQGDANANVVVGVTNGTASTGTPSKPTIPTGALELRTYLVPQGATKTSQATVQGSVNYAIPYGGSLGRMHYNVLPMDGVGDNRPSQIYVEQNGSFYLPTDRILEFRFRANISTANYGVDSSRGSWTFGFMLDGAVVNENEIEYTRSWSNKEFTHRQVVSQGSHSVAIRSHAQWGDTVFFHYAAGARCGRVFEVWDLGVAQ